jgi:hypothetical protein
MVSLLLCGRGDGFAFEALLLALGGFLTLLLGSRNALVVLVDSTGGIQELMGLAGEERVTRGTRFGRDLRYGRSGFERVTACASHFSVGKPFGVSILFHCKKSISLRSTRLHRS